MLCFRSPGNNKLLEGASENKHFSALGTRTEADDWGSPSQPALLHITLPGRNVKFGREVLKIATQLTTVSKPARARSILKAQSHLESGTKAWKQAQSRHRRKACLEVSRMDPKCDLMSVRLMHGEQGAASSGSPPQAEPLGYHNNRPAFTHCSFAYLAGQI